MRRGPVRRRQAHAAGQPAPVTPHAPPTPAGPGDARTPAGAARAFGHRTPVRRRTPAGPARPILPPHARPAPARPSRVCAVPAPSRRCGARAERGPGSPSLGAIADSFTISVNHSAIAAAAPPLREPHGTPRSSSAPGVRASPARGDPAGRGPTPGGGGPGGHSSAPPERGRSAATPERVSQDFRRRRLRDPAQAARPDHKAGTASTGRRECTGRRPRTTTSRPKKAARVEETGGVLLSRALSGQVPSALRGLTALFGTGRGVSLSLKPPEIAESSRRPLKTAQCHATRGYHKVVRQALDPLVPVSCTHCCASRSGLSTWWSTRGLTPSRGWESSSRGRLPA